LSTDKRSLTELRELRQRIQAVGEIGGLFPSTISCRPWFTATFDSRHRTRRTSVEAAERHPFSGLVKNAKNVGDLGVKAKDLFQSLPNFGLIAVPFSKFAKL
jgi:hypothetical protein